MIRLSANLGFLWKERTLAEAIHAAKAAGFDAVECHRPYETPPSEVNEALVATGLQMISLNTVGGDAEKGESGLAALAGREADARRSIDQAISYADAISCANIHVMAGLTDKGPQSRKVFAENLRYACVAANPLGKTILIEPLNHHDVPGYHISTLEEAREVLQEVGEANLKIMFDCYHLQIMGGDLLRNYKSASGDIGQVQFAGVPGRSEPDRGEVNLVWLLNEIAAAGYNGMFGAEYKPRTNTDESLGWMKSFRAKA